MRWFLAIVLCASSALAQLPWQAAEQNAVLAQGGPTIDALAAITTSLRWQSHAPNSTTPLGMFTDTAGTTPATADGDLVAALRDYNTGSVIFTQPTSSKRPKLRFDAATGRPYLFFDGVDDYLTGTSLGLSAFAASINASPVGGTSDALLLGDENGANWNVGWGLRQHLGGTPPQFAGWVNAYNSTNQVNFTFTNPIGTALFTHSFASLTVELFRDGTSIGTHAGTVPSYTSAALYLGADPSAEAVKGAVSAVVIYSKTDRAAVESYLQSLHPFPFVAFEGNSIMTGSTLTSPFANQAIATAGADFYEAAWKNFAVNGSKVSDLNDRAAALDTAFAAWTGRKLLVIEIGHNDFASSGDSAATFVANLKAYCLARKAATSGLRILLCDVLPSTVSGLNTWRASVHTLYAADPSFWDYQIQFTNNATMGADAAASDTSLYSDGTHPTQTGANALAPDVKTGIEAELP